MSRKNNSVKTEDVKTHDVKTEAEQTPAQQSEGKFWHGVPEPARPVAISAVVLSEPGFPLVSGDLLVICTDPGFKRGGIEHERLKVYKEGQLTGQQIAQMSREPKLTLVKVS